MYQNLSHRLPTILLAVAILCIGLALPTISIAGDAVFIDSAQIKVSGNRSDANLGKSTSGAGDVNNDGYKDAILGAPDTKNESDGRRGHAYIILGSQNMDTEIDLKTPTPGTTIKIRGLHAGDQLGFSVSDAGDVNNDGFDDFLVGSPNAHGSGGMDESGNGRAYLIYGSPNLPDTISVGSLGSMGVTIIGGQEDGKLGYSVSGAGDFDGDGIPDLLIGAPEEEHGESSSGAAYLIRGGSLPSVIDLKMSHASVTRFKTGGNNHNVGHSVADLEDFDGDGYADIAITSIHHGDDGGLHAGRAWVIYGGVIPPAEANLNSLSSSGLAGTKIRIPDGDHELGQAIAGAGDADNDGDSELLLSRSLHDQDPTTLQTVAYLVRGSSDRPEFINLAQGGPGITAYKTLFDNDEDGQTVHGVYDHSGDGLDDHIVGIPRTVILEQEKGSAHRIDGNQDLGSSEVLDLHQQDGRAYLGTKDNQSVGRSVGGAGDLNNDRSNDLMIGAPGDSPYGRLRAGVVYFYLGNELRSPNQVQTSAVGQTVDITWNNRAIYDVIELFKDDVLIDTLGGEDTSYTDENVQYGDHTYQVRGIRRDITTKKRGSSIRVLNPISNFMCRSLGRNVTLTWENNDAFYTATDVYRDGVLIASVPGGAVSYSDIDVDYMGHTYQLVSRGDRTETLPVSCMITVLQNPTNPACSAEPNPVSNNVEATITWSNGPDTIYESIKIYRDGFEVASLDGWQTSYTEVLLEPGTYMYSVEGRADNDRAISVRAYCEVTDPVAPKLLTCSAEGSTVFFNWVNTDAYDFIEIEFGPTNGSYPVAVLAQLPGNTQSYQTNSLGPDNYTVSIRGRKFNGQSGRIDCTLSVPVPLSNLMASAMGQTVHLSWSNGGLYDFIDIYRDNLFLETISGTLTNYTDDEVPFGDRIYMLKARLRLGTTDPLMRGITVLRRPEALTCVGEADQVRLSWTNPLPSYSEIDIYRGGNHLTTVSGDDMEYVDMGLSPATYDYSLKARLDTSTSDATECETVIPEPINTISTGLLDGSNAIISWSPPVPEATSIRLFRDGVEIASLPPTTISYIDPDLFPGVYSYCVRADIDANYSTNNCKNAIVPEPPTEIICSVDAAQTTITWTNNGVYDEIIVTRDGGTIEENIPGTSSSYFDPNPGPGPHLYQVYGKIANFVSKSLDCTVTVPYPPAQLACSLSGGTDSVLTWENTEPSTNIVVYRDGSLIATLAPDSGGYTDAGVAPGTYEYCVVNVFDHSDGSKTSASTCCTLIVPFPPTNLSCVSISGDVALSWTNNDSYETVELRRDGNVIAELGGTETSYIDAAVTPGNRTYTVSGAILENDSTTDSCSEDVPAAITNLGLTALAGTVSLSWDHSGPGSEVDITRNDTLIATLDSGTTSYQDPGNSMGDYEYCLTMRIGAGTSPTVCSSIHVLGDPSALACSSAAGFVNLSWENNDTYATLTLNRDGDLLTILDGDSTSYTDDSATVGSHTYTLTALNGPSTSATIDCTVDHFLTAPQGLACSVTGGEVDLSWANGDTYESITVSRDGTLLAILPGDITSYHDASATHGARSYSLVASGGSIDSDPTSCNVDVPATPMDMASSTLDSTVTLTWTLAAPGSEQLVTRDGNPIATISGSATSYSDTGVPPGNYTYCVTNTIGASTSATTCTAARVLANPSGFSCGSAAGLVSLSWNNNDTYESILLERDGVKLALLNGGTNTYVDDSAATGNHTYSITASAEADSTTSGTFDCSVLHELAPTSGLGCSVTAGEVDLSWSNNDTYESISLSRDGNFLALLPGDATSYHDSDSQAHGAHTYTLVAAAGSIESDPTSCTVDVPSTPENLSCTLSNGAQVQMSWDLPAAGIAVDIYRDGSLIDTLGGSSTSYTDTPGPGTYEYSVVNRSADGTSPATSCSIVVPVPLSGFSCSTIGDGNNLSWTNGETYDAIAVYRDDVKIGSANGGTEFFTDFPLDAGTYNYEIVARIGTSETAGLTCSVTILPPPINLACTFYGAPVNLNWENQASYTTIHIERNGVLHASISGNATSYQDIVPVEGDYSYVIYGEHADGVTTSTTCAGHVERFLRGDANGDTNCDIADGIWVLNWLFIGGQEPTCFDSADFDDNGLVTIGDAMLMIFYYLHAEGMPSMPPANNYPDAGLDPTDDTLDCIESPY